MNGPEKRSEWEDWRSFRRDGDSTEFDYSDATETHIGDKSQSFHYGQDPIPEKM